MGSKLQVGEVIRKVLEASIVAEKQKVLRFNNSMALREVIRLQHGLDKFTALLRTDFTYVPAKAPYPFNESKLIIAARGFRAYRLPPSERMTRRFGVLLSSLHREEAEQLLKAVRGELDLGLSATEIEAALPGIFGARIAGELDANVKAQKASAPTGEKGIPSVADGGTQAASTSAEVAIPVKRGRGRPRKHPLPVQPPVVEDELTDEEKAKYAAGFRVIEANPEQS